MLRTSKYCEETEKKNWREKKNIEEHSLASPITYTFSIAGRKITWSKIEASTTNQMKRCAQWPEWWRRTPGIGRDGSGNQKIVRHAHTQNQWIVQMRWIDGNEGKKWMKWMCVFFSLLLALLFGDSKYDKKKLSIELQGNLSIYFLIFLNLVFCLLPFAICVCESRNYRRTCCGLIDLDLCPIKSNWAQNVCYNRDNSQSRLSLSISLFGPLVGGIRMGCIIYIYCYVLSNLHTFPINSSLQTCSFVPWRTSRCVGLHNNVMYIQTDIVVLNSIESRYIY